MAGRARTSGLVTWDDSLPVAGTFDPAQTSTYCMHDILSIDEAKQITSKFTATDEAIAAYQSISGNQ
ncbi:MAG: hypothetical protein R3C15_08945 [Thermoleophilia bacterium]